MQDADLAPSAAGDQVTDEPVGRQSADRVVGKLCLLRDARAVNAELPGGIRTAMMDRLAGGNICNALGLEPVGRLGKPEESTETVPWMASDMDGVVTGAATVVDGGCRCGVRGIDGVRFRGRGKLHSMSPCVSRPP